MGLFHLERARGFARVRWNGRGKRLMAERTLGEGERESGEGRRRGSCPRRADAGSTGSPLRQNESFMPRALAFTTSSRTRRSLSPFRDSPPDGERLTGSTRGFSTGLYRVVATSLVFGSGPRFPASRIIRLATPINAVSSGLLNGF